MRIAAVVLGLVLAGQTLWAAEPAKEDFAAGYELALRKDSGLHHLPLPEKVYQQVVRSDLADIRVFNGQGQVVPHMLRFERKMAAPEVRRQELPFSPFSNMVPTGALVSQSDTRVFRGAGGTGKGGEPGFIQTTRVENEKIRQRDGYLIETGAIESWPYRLELGIRAADDFMLTMARDGSDDLINWYPVDRQTLARLSYQGYLVEQKADAPISQRLKYLRLSWPADEEDIHIDSVTAVSWISGAPLPRNWIRLRGRPEKDEKHPAILRLNFESPGFMPVEEVRISFTGYRNLVQAKLRSRLDENSPWIQRGQGTYYLLQLEGTVLRNDTLTIAPASDRFWQLEMQSEGENPASLPDLELGWRPHELYFVAQGPGPYVLAFGNGQMAKDVRPEAGITTLVQEAEKKSLPIAAATLRGEMVLGGPARLSPLPPPLPWKKWLLWAVLIGGVLLIARMAFTLHRQMRN